VKEFFDRLALRYEAEANVLEKQGKIDEALLYAALAGHTRGHGMPQRFADRAKDLGYDRLLATLRGGHRGAINSAVFSPAGARVLSASEDGSLAWWDPSDARLVWSSTTAEARYASITLVDNRSIAAIAHRPLALRDGQTAGRVSLHEASADRLAPVPARDRQVPHRIVHAVVSSDGRRVLLAGDDVAEWNPVEDEIDLVSRDLAYAVWSAEYSRDGKMIAAGGTDGAIRIFGGTDFLLDDRADVITRVAWGQDGLLGAMGRKSPISVWDVGKRKRVNSLTVGGKPVAIEFCNRDGRLLIGERLTNGGVIRLRDPLADRSDALELRWEGVPLTVASLGNECDRVVTGWRDGTLRIFSLGGRSPVADADLWEVWQRKLGLTIVGGAIEPLSGRDPEPHVNQQTFSR
jgi:WD40 repeat protein